MINEEKDVEKFYDIDASTYDNRWKSIGGIATSLSQYQIIFELCMGWRGKRIIEVGCGTGRFSPLLSEIGEKLTLVDISVEMLRAARMRLNEIALSPYIGINSSAYHLPFQSDSFDCAVSINVFNHLHLHDVAIDEIARVLKRNGKLVINFANLYSYYLPAALIINKNRRSISGDVFSIWLSLRQIRQYLENAGFEIMHIVGNVHIPSYLDQPIVRDVLRLLDIMSRKSFLKYWAPSIFFACEKKY